jgi:FKBP-type peptidyl-prolyl cis-trans isomerase 2
MRTVREGDRVQVHYVKRYQDGSVSRSHHGPPLELTVGRDHPRLPGLGLALVGAVPGSTTTVGVPRELAHGPADPGRVRRWPRSRFPDAQELSPGQWVRITDRRGRERSVRVLTVRERSVRVDTNRRGAGQSLVLVVELVAIRDAGGA